MTTRKGLHSDLAVPPGEYLAEVMEEQGLARAELARRSTISDTDLAAILNGTAPVSARIASQLAEATGVPSNIWLGLESEYRLVVDESETRNLKGES